MKKQLSGELAQAFGVVARTEEGRKVLRHIFEATGFDKSDLVVNPTTLEVCPISTSVNVAIRGVWLGLRKMIPADILADIEIVQEGPQNDDRESIE